MESLHWLLYTEEGMPMHDVFKLKLQGYTNENIPIGQLVYLKFQSPNITKSPEV